MRRIFGTDIGGVLAPPVSPSQKDQTDDQSLSEFLPIPDSFRVLSRIANELLKPEETFVVSYCDQATEVISRRWLDIHNFFEITRIPHGNLFYCRERSHKNIICQELEITDFVDDNIKVIKSLETVLNKYLFKTKEKELTIIDPTISIVRSWLDVEKEYFNN